MTKTETGFVHNTGAEGRPASRLYHEGNRHLQDAFDSRRISDRLEDVMTKDAFSEDNRAFIESSIYFFLATADTEGRPDCSFKGGEAGFVRVTGPSELAFPDYDGNGMFKSLGNIAVNPNVGMLFISMHEAPRRLRVNGRARIVRDDPLLGEMPGAQLIIRVESNVIFPNCPRYIPNLRLEEESPFLPKEGKGPLEPAWKEFEDLKEHVPARHPSFGVITPPYPA